jgi:hypothetical protein
LDKTANLSGALSASIFTVKMLAVFIRLLPVPKHTFFLFGPRGTEKTT